jgi:predicted HTH domain antitoxin
MKDKIVLNSAEQRRLLVLNQLEKGAVTVGEAAALQGIRPGAGGSGPPR